MDYAEMIRTPCLDTQIHDHMSIPHLNVTPSFAKQFIFV